MKHVGSAFFIEVGAFWDHDTAPYLLGVYKPKEDRYRIAKYQQSRFYSDEVLADRNVLAGENIKIVKIDRSSERK